MSRLLLLVLAGLSFTLPSCTASLDLDRFRKAEGKLDETPSAAKYFDVRFSATSMQSHVDEYFEIRVVDRNNRVQAKAVYADVVVPEFSIYMADVVPKTNPPYRLDFWADHNKSSKYDGIVGGINDKDHAWRRTLADPLPDGVRFADDRYEVTFPHDTDFVDIFTDLDGKQISGDDTLLPFKMSVVGGGAYAGKTIELRVVDKATARLVGLHRRGRAAETYGAEISGILDEETAYVVTAYVDANGDGQLSPGDPSWSVDHVSTSAGIDARLDLGATPQAPIVTGE